MKVIKRGGVEREFDPKKIRRAITNANRDSGELSDGAVAEVVADVMSKCGAHEGPLDVKSIQDMVEESLRNRKAYATAREYIKYRDMRTRNRENDSKLMRDFAKKLYAVEVVNQNANLDEKSFGGRKAEAAGEMLKWFALENCMSRMSRDNHLSNEIYIHDLDSYALGEHNCLSIPFDKLLAEGFNTRQTDIRPANSVSTAFQLVAIIFQIQSLQQFGGVSATHLDWTMVPYVRKSFRKHFIDGMHYIEGVEFDISDATSIDAEEYKAHEKAYAYAMDLTKRELRQAAEGMMHNLNTLQSRSGNQLPFSSINYGTCTLPEGRMVIRALLEAGIKGVGKLHKTSIFPCGIFQYMKGVNDRPGTPNYDLYRLALQSTARRLYPNYMSCNWGVDMTGNELDVQMKQNYLDSLSDNQMQQLVAWCESNPELADSFGLVVIDN